MANDDLCKVLNSIIAARSVDGLKSIPKGLNLWTTGFRLAGFDACQIVDIPDVDPNLVSTGMIACGAWYDDIEAARTLRDGTHAALSCGKQGVSFPGYTPESVNLFYPDTGLAVSADIEPSGLDFAFWRRVLRGGDPRTTAYAHRAIISIQVISSKQ